MADNIGRPKNTPEKFWRKVDIRGQNECWPWMFSFRNGYGHHTINRAAVYAHRYAWELYNGASIPPGMMIMHSCDHKWCCNPAHLSIGDAGTNTRAAYESGLCRTGEKHHKTTISRAVIEAIRADPRPQLVIAASTGVTQQHISRIKANLTRKYG